ncbi:MAG: bifunctional adenosylcobinamide kinase/adenosylcobinamide-phosphate guanylyltransferase [Chloroflexi bacterium]|nr:bifunctional adenosylcobinamide kinase/adenosylcobinamide-phosphate guanylyltransferase [Chloroflexota bacterium]MCY4110970.1 bifunctional adenosylcobinamide kinase/adenosylcobinamide-phosphate guanylyltransferase [Chloroflexota bacterium]
MSKRLTLVLGGVRAGKSRHAQTLAQTGQRVLVVATAEAGDAEMAARIQAHRAERPEHWDTLEEPLDPAAALVPRLPDYDTVLLDCLTLWVSNLLLRPADESQARPDISGEADRLLKLYEDGDASWIVVSNEVGLGVIPANELARAFADELGRVNQIVAAAADDVIVMYAGVPVNISTLASARMPGEGTGGR